MTELLPCSKCRRVPGERRLSTSAWECGCGNYCYGSAEQWNRLCGAPLTLAEKPQDVAMCEPPPHPAYVSKPLADFERMICGLRFKADPAMPPGAMAIADDEPSVGDGVRVVERTQADSERMMREWREWYRACREVAECNGALLVPTATCDGKRWRECGDPLARWSVMACSGGG